MFPDFGDHIGDEHSSPAKNHQIPRVNTSCRCQSVTRRSP
jgi:hypothetical protein